MHMKNILLNAQQLLLGGSEMYKSNEKPHLLSHKLNQLH